MTRTRFAPSPTGVLHMGGARTALFCWLFARHTQGTYLVRIEDTDIERSQAASATQILESLEWLGLSSDEPPTFQSSFQDRHESAATTLCDGGQAYWCDCSPERLDQVRDAARARGDKPRYDGLCRTRGLTSAPDRVLRFHMPDMESVAFHDVVHGLIEVQASELDDFVLMRRGRATYNFACVVDDHAQDITHVLRGDDHLNNTTRQVLVYLALGTLPPMFVHLPMILTESGERMSKRHGVPGVLAWRDRGVMPQALVRYLGTLGYHDGDDPLMGVNEIASRFDLSRVQRSPARHSPSRLLATNAAWMRTLSLDEKCERAGIEADWPKAAVDLVGERAQTLQDLHAQVAAIVTGVDGESMAADVVSLLTEETTGALLSSFLSAWDETPDHVSVAAKQAAKEHGVKFAAIGKPLRAALIGTPHGADLSALMSIIGSNEAKARVNRWIPSA